MLWGVCNAIAVGKIGVSHHDKRLGRCNDCICFSLHWESIVGLLKDTEDYCEFASEHYVIDKEWPVHITPRNRTQST